MPGKENGVRKRKRRTSSSGEKIQHVTKDGEKVVRVKKQRRRSKQKKEINNERILNLVFWRTFFILTTCFAVASFVGLRLFYVNGPDYEEGMKEKLRSELNGDIDLRGLAFSPRGMRAGYLEFTAENKEAFVSELGLSKLSADQNFWGIFSERWKGSNLDVKEGVMRIRPDVNNFSFSPKSDQFQFDGLIINKFDLYEGLNPLIVDSSFSLFLNSYVISGGQINLPLFGDVELKRFAGNYHSTPTTIEGSVISGDVVSSFEGTVKDGNFNCIFDSVILNSDTLAEPIKSLAVNTVKFESIAVQGRIGDFNYLGDCYLSSKIENFPKLKKWVVRFGGDKFSSDIEKLEGEGRFSYENKELVIKQMKLKGVSGLTLEMWDFRENEEFNLILIFPLSWQSRIELYPKIKSLLSISQAGFSLRLKCKLENGIVVDDLEDRLFHLQQEDVNSDEEALRRQLEQLLE